MVNRKLPFGYEMRRGVVCIEPVEACIVKEIYTAYTGGMSYRQITSYLNTQAVPYNEQNKPWNKNMVARILGCELYIGNESYPAIISAEEYHQAEAVKPSTGTPLDTNGRIKTIRQLARCAVCGSTLVLSANKQGWTRWNCPSCKGISADAVAPDTINALFHILTAIGEAPEMVQMPPRPERAASAFLEQGQAELDEMIHTDEFDESAAKANAISLAAARFDALGSEDYETVRIQYILARTEQNDGLDTELLRQITSAILIHSTGAVSLKLKNGQIMERSDFK